MNRKRKLNIEGVPEAAIEHEVSAPRSSGFDALGLDARLLQAITKEKFSEPTSVQAKAIPLALEGRDVLAHAKTGSGKTAAYILPVLQSVLRSKLKSKSGRTTSAIILVPTKELANQVTKAINRFSYFCSREIEVVNLVSQIQDQAQRALLASSPEIVVATPARAAAHLNDASLVADNLVNLVIDEADLVLSYGYEDDLKTIVGVIPPNVQTFLASATLTAEVDTLKELFCRDPVVLDLQEEEKDDSGLSQYVVKCAEDEKFLLLFALFKLKLVTGKCIVFVGDIDRCYRLKLYLEQFGIKSCVLNSELPINSRVHVIEEFNRDLYDIIIATDERDILGNSKKHRDHEIASTALQNDKAETEEKAIKVGSHLDADSLRSQSIEAEASATKKKAKANHIKKGKGQKIDKEYGVSRGIDFQNVACVLNFDLPPTAKSYTHRIGRTARANRTGIALSFMVPTSLYRKHKPSTTPICANDEAVLATITADQATRGRQVQPYRFDMAKLDGFRYRVASALKAVSAGAIKEARIRELRHEVMNSERLKRHLEENPEDLKWLRHDTQLRPAKVQPHLKHVPDYLMPKGAGSEGKALEDVGFVGLQKSGQNRIRAARVRNKLRRKPKNGVGAGKKADPLKSFNARGRR